MNPSNARTPIQGQITFLPTADLHATDAFYQGVLGLPLVRAQGAEVVSAPAHSRIARGRGRYRADRLEVPAGTHRVDAAAGLGAHATQRPGVVQLTPRHVRTYHGNVEMACYHRMTWPDGTPSRACWHRCEHCAAAAAIEEGIRAGRIVPLGPEVPGAGSPHAGANDHDRRPSCPTPKNEAAGARSPASDA